MRGFTGIGVYHMKTEINYGTLFRSAVNLNADFIFLIGKRFRKQSSDTIKAHRHIPLFEYTDTLDFLDHLPYDCRPIAVEIAERSSSLLTFSHPERAAYVLGPEDDSLPAELTRRCVATLQIPTVQCLNVSVAGAIVLYDRLAKAARRKQDAATTDTEG